MNKCLAIAVFALAFAAVNAQNATASSFCRENDDCGDNLCCGASKTGAVNYVQFNCVAARNFTTNTTGFACIQPNQTYTDICATEERTCISSTSRYTICGGKLSTATIDLFNSDL